MRKAILVLTMILMSGCSYIKVTSEVDSTASAPSKSDPVSVDISEITDISDRNLAVKLKEELVENKFNYDDKNPKYKFLIDYDNKQVETGSEPDFWAPGKRNTIYGAQAWLTLSAYTAKDPQKLSIWKASTWVIPEFYIKHKHAMIKSLLECFGKNINDSLVDLDKSYKEDK